MECIGYFFETIEKQKTKRRDRFFFITTRKKCPCGKEIIFTNKKKKNINTVLCFVRRFARLFLSPATGPSPNIVNNKFETLLGSVRFSRRKKMFVPSLPYRYIYDVVCSINNNNNVIARSRRPDKCHKNLLKQT